MKRLAMLAILSMVMMLTSGCGPGVAYSASERENRYSRITDYDMRQLADDFDLFWLQEDASRMSYWRVRSLR